MRLYEIAQAYRAAIERESGEWTDEIDAIADDLAAKTDACLVLAREAALEAESIRAEEKRLGELRRAAENRSERLRAYVLRSMVEAGTSALKGRFHARVQAGKPRVVVDDLDALPAEMVRVKREADKVALGAALDAGEVPGAHREMGPASLVVR